MTKLILIFSTALALTLVAACGKKDDDKPAPGTPTGPATPANPEPQNPQGGNQPAGGPAAPAPGPAGNPNSLAYQVGIEGSWVTDCVPSEGYDNPHNPGYGPVYGPRLSKRAKLVFLNSEVQFVIETFTDPECMDPNSRNQVLLHVTGTFQVGREMWEDGGSKELLLIYQKCLVGNCNNFDPYRAIVGSDVLVYRLRHNRLYFGANSAGGYGTFWNLRTPFYREGTQPTAPRQ